MPESKLWELVTSYLESFQNSKKHFTDLKSGKFFFIPFESFSLESWEYEFILAIKDVSILDHVIYLQS